MTLATTDPPAHHAATLKAHFKQRCAATDPQHQNWQIRVHRAISWLRRAEETPPDEARFLFLWIALNSLYSRWNSQDNVPDKDTRSRKDFFYSVCDHRGRAAIGLVLLKIRPAVKKLLENQYLSEVFWRDPTNPRAVGWAAQEANHLASNVRHAQWPAILAQVMERLYVFRGQLVHGASTSGGKLNRTTLAYCLETLEAIVPPVIRIVIDHHRDDQWPALCYPPQQ